MNDYFVNQQFLPPFCLEVSDLEKVPFTGTLLGRKIF
nr:MAG TPA: hypothetical protein [Caudoviricetes sp.]